MNVGVLGTGMVGQSLATKLLELGHAVTMGSRSADNEAATQWATARDGSATSGTFRDAAGFGELIVNCTAGSASLAALDAAGAENLSGKVLIDVANPLDFSRGMPPSLLVSNNDSLGEQIQRAFPDARIVKALNTINHQLMVDPERVAAEHDVFICGDDADAKAEVRSLLESFGWSTDSIKDLGDITAARATEGYLPLWLRIMGTLGTTDFNIKVVR